MVVSRGVGMVLYFGGGVLIDLTFVIPLIFYFSGLILSCVLFRSPWHEEHRLLVCAGRHDDLRILWFRPRSRNGFPLGFVLSFFDSIFEIVALLDSLPPVRVLRFNG